MRGFDGRNVVHCSYHKSLTSYYANVAGALFNRRMPWSRGYRHFNSRIESFYDHFADLTVASVNNRALDFDRLGDFRITRFVRDPRDLVVPGTSITVGAPRIGVGSPTPPTRTGSSSTAGCPTG